jgi:subtilisin family serine protease
VEAGPVANRVIVLFSENSVPADAANRVARAGGKLAETLDAVGIAVATPATVDGATLINNLRKDSAVTDADFDYTIRLIGPRQVAGDAVPISPDTHFPHPLPTFSALPPDFFYTSSPQEWSVKRVGAQGGGVPGGGPGAWDVTKGAGAKIAMLDTGVNPAHPDLSPNLIFNAALTFDIPGAFGTPNCEVPDPANPPFDLPADQTGHGTYTSSLAAAAIGGGLMIGVAPQASILNIKVLRSVPASPDFLKAIGIPDTPFNRCQFRDGVGLFSWALEGMLVATFAGADVISMSFGALIPRNGGVASAFNRVANFVSGHGVVMVAAVGNEGVDLNKTGPVGSWPAEASNVISVIATTNPGCVESFAPNAACAAGPDGLAFYSDFGSSLHGLAAPGGSVPAGGCGFSGVPCDPTGFVRGACSAGLPGTVEPAPAGYPATGPPPAGTSWGCFNFPGIAQHAWYIQAIGTSASAPHVAGVAALVKSVNPGLNQEQIRTILQESADDIGNPQLFNFGLVDATRAVNMAAGR